MYRNLYMPLRVAGGGVYSLSVLLFSRLSDELVHLMNLLLVYLMHYPVLCRVYASCRISCLCIITGKRSIASQPAASLFTYINFTVAQPKIIVSQLVIFSANLD